MKRLLAIALGAVCLIALVARIHAGPGQPFGGDDTGCVPDSTDHLRCANTVTRAFSSLVSSVIRCHRRQAMARMKGQTFDEESCEEATPSSGGRSAEEKFNARISRIAPHCSAAQIAGANSLRDTLLASKTNPSSLDALNGTVYCDSATGSMIDASGDDAGWVPASTNFARCENMVGSNLGRLVSQVIRCHSVFAKNNFLAKPFDEESCENVAQGRYNSAADKLTAMGICPLCQSNANQKATGSSLITQFDNANASMYPCPASTTTTSTTTTSSTVVTTSTTSTTTTTLLPLPTTTTTLGTTTTTSTTTTTLGCTCAGGTPAQMASTTGIGSGNCGHLESDTNPNFFSLACGGLYVGGASVGVPLPFQVPDNGTSISKISACSGTSMTLAAATAAEAGGNRCSGGSNTNGSCTTNADCPGGTCKFLKCTKAGCQFGPPLPLPNGAHLNAATSTCVINTVSVDGSGSGDCSTGVIPNFNLPLGSTIYLAGDLLPMRCVGGTTPGANCAAGGGCGTVTPGSCPGGTCVNDNGRCTDNGAVCCSDADCNISATCETGACSGGTNNGNGCITSADCPGGICTTFIQPCPICEATTMKCNGGPNDTLACTPVSSTPNGDFSTAHECPPPTSLNIGTLAIGFALTTGTKTKTAVDLTDQTNVFCGFCKNKTTSAFKNPAVACTSNADCAGFGGDVPPHTSCGQRTSGAFTATDIARTIVETGNAVGPIIVGGPAQPQTLVSIFCIPPSFSPAVDAAADLPGPGAVALQGTVVLTP